MTYLLVVDRRSTPVTPGATGNFSAPTYCLAHILMCGIVSGMSRYHEIAADLRVRIRAEEFPVGAQLPGISALQEHYGGVSLGTIRAAQQHLVEDGMLRTEQGRGAFVTATESRRDLDVLATLSGARAGLDVALEALRSQRYRSVTFDLGADDDTYFVLTTALQDFAARQRDEADHDPEHDGQPDAGRLDWARAADDLLDRIEAGLDAHAPAPTG